MCSSGVHKTHMNNKCSDYASSNYTFWAYCDSTGFVTNEIAAYENDIILEGDMWYPKC